MVAPGKARGNGASQFPAPEGRQELPRCTTQLSNDGCGVSRVDPAALYVLPLFARGVGAGRLGVVAAAGFNRRGKGHQNPGQAILTYCSRTVHTRPLD